MERCQLVQVVEERRHLEGYLASLDSRGLSAAGTVVASWPPYGHCLASWKSGSTSASTLPASSSHLSATGARPASCASGSGAGIPAHTAAAAASARAGRSRPRTVQFVDLGVQRIQQRAVLLPPGSIAGVCQPAQALPHRDQVVDPAVQVGDPPRSRPPYRIAPAAVPYRNRNCPGRQSPAPVPGYGVKKIDIHGPCSVASGTPTDGKPGRGRQQLRTSSAS
jgi:hypothetical protein